MAPFKTHVRQSQWIFNILLFITSTVSVDIPITCTTQLGIWSGSSESESGNSPTSIVSCLPGETMVSCGYSGSGQTIQIGGTIINATTNVCTAYAYSSYTWIQAVARCCTFPTEANISTTTVQSTAGESVSVQCPANSILTGCSMYLVSGIAKAIQGVFVGNQSSPPQTAVWISTDNQCNAEGNTSTTVQAIARCLSIHNANYSLPCETKTLLTTYSSFGLCQSGLQMMSCAGLNPQEISNDNRIQYVTSTDTCLIVNNEYWKPLYVSAICCKMNSITSPHIPVTTLPPAASAWFYHPSDVPVRCSATPGWLECATYNGQGCAWGAYGTTMDYASYEVMSGVIAPATYPCPVTWVPDGGFDPCEVLGCYAESYWYFMDRPLTTGGPVRCTSIPNMLECASDDGFNCKWGVYDAGGWSPYQKMNGVSGKYPLAVNCPVWASSIDACQQLECYSNSTEYSIIGQEAPIACTSRFGYFSSQTTISCEAGETMVSCGYSGGDRPGGNIINSTTNVCTAYERSSSFRTQVVGRCCKFLIPNITNITTSTIQSTAGESVSVQCPGSSILTGCSMNFISGVANQTKGAFPGAESSRAPQTAAWISTGNQCNAQANTGTTVRASARCLSIEHPVYSFLCETRATYTDSVHSKGCPHGLQMMDCTAFSTLSGLHQQYVTTSDECVVRNDAFSKLHANAICCQMVLTTSLTTTMDTYDTTESGDTSDANNEKIVLFLPHIWVLCVVLIHQM
eukprot:672045_1